jgi:hypothetical protein
VQSAQAPKRRGLATRRSPYTGRAYRLSDFACAPLLSCQRRNHCPRLEGNCESIGNPGLPLMGRHRDLPCPAIARANDHASAQTCPAYSTGGSSCKHCPSEETHAAACAVSTPCVLHNSRLRAVSVENDAAAHHESPEFQTNRRPVPIQHQSSSWDIVAPVTGVGVFRYSHKTCEVRVTQS